MSADGVDDKYTIPGSGGVLRNKLGLESAAQLDQAANNYATVGLARLWVEPLPERLDFAYLQHVHKTMLGKVYAWAGQLRDVDVQAVGAGVAYARPDFLAENVSTFFRQLERRDYLRGVGVGQFPSALAEQWGTLSALHPFRDGNTRSQSLYVSALAERAGFSLEWSKVSVAELRHARLLAVTGREQPLADLLGGVIRPMEPGLGRAELTLANVPGISREALEAQALTRMTRGDGSQRNPSTPPRAPRTGPGRESGLER